MPAAKRSTKSTTRARKTKRATAKSTTRTSARKTTRSATAKKSTRTSARGSAASKTARRSAASSARGSSATSRSKKRSPSAAFMAPVQPDTALSAIVGKKPLPRTQITKKLWSYIKKHDLQDANKRTMINADANLRPVFGGKRKVDMFQMTKLVSQHVAAIK